MLANANAIDHQLAIISPEKFKAAESSVRLCYPASPTTKAESKPSSSSFREESLPEKEIKEAKEAARKEAKTTPLF